jgi:hypothetical protein
VGHGTVLHESAIPFFFFLHSSEEQHQCQQNTMLGIYCFVQNVDPMILPTLPAYQTLMSRLGYRNLVKYTGMSRKTGYLILAVYI